MGRKRRYCAEKIIESIYTLMPYKKETILPLLEKLNLTNYENNEPLRSGVDFLTGVTFQPPVFTDEHADTPGLFITLLRVPELWDDNDRLVLQLISAPNTWARCQDRFLRTIVPMMDMPGTSSSIVLRFSYFTSFLQQRGYTPEEIGSRLIGYSGDGHNFDLAPLKFTPLRKFLQDLMKSAEGHVVDAYLHTWKDKPWNSLFYRLLAKAHPEREMEYLENRLLRGETLADRYELSRVLLQNNVQKYADLVGRVTGTFTANQQYAAALLGYHLLAVQLPAQYVPVLKKAAYDFLEAPNNNIEAPAHNSLRASSMPPPVVLAIKDLLQYDQPAVLSYLGNYLNAKRYMHPDTFQVLADAWKENAVSLLLQALDNDYDARVVLPALSQLPVSLYMDQLWPFTLHKLKSVRSLVAVILAEHPRALEKAGKLLEHKKADQRLTAVQILCRLNNIHARTLLQEAVQKEINDDARDLMLETLDYPTIEDGDDLTVVTRLVAYAKKRHKLSRPAEKWLDDTSLPLLYLQDGQAMSIEMMRFLLYRMSRVREVRADMEVKPLLRLIDRSRSGEFASALFQQYQQQGGDASIRYLLIVAAMLGDDLLVEKLKDAMHFWIESKRFKMAEHGIAALAMQGSANALRFVEFLSRRYRIRKSAVGAAALATLQSTAAELGISIHELGDRIAPDFGFTGMFKYVEINNETWRVFIDNHFKPGYLNENNRRFKSIPTGTSNEMRESFKLLAKDITDAVKSQSQRLEYFLVIQRKWSSHAWQQLFLGNPLMFVFARRLLWGLFDEQDQLITPFYCQDNMALLTAVDTEITLLENTSVRILHPLMLDTATLQQWKYKFEERGIEPVFPQLDRPVSALLPQQAYTTLVDDFEDISMESEVLHAHMEQKGWKLSEGSDSKFMYAWHKTDDVHQLEVILEMSNIAAADQFLSKLGKLYFIDKTKTSQRWFRSTDKEAADCLLPLKNVPPVFYSEAITDITVSRGQA